jgi:hypothetical protein
MGTRQGKLSDEDIEAINLHSRVIRAGRELTKAVEAITNWSLASARGVPKNEFGLIAAFEDALGGLKEAIIRATYQRVMRSNPIRHR